MALIGAVRTFAHFASMMLERLSEKRSSPKGVLRVQNRFFDEVLREEVGDWLGAEETRILLCGMIGSRQGWVEVKYVSCPAGIADLATAVRAVPFSAAEVLIIPGVAGIRCMRSS